MNKKVVEALSYDYDISMYKKKPLYSFTKRCFDILFSLFLILLLSWLLLIIGILVMFTSKGKIIYGHERIGKNGKKFKILKFRSMNDDSKKLEEVLTEEQLEEWYENYKVEDDPRVTKFGKFLRKTSLDELPQLFNILGGSMSFIGPRPIIEEELNKKYDDKEKELLLKVKPGLTGFWASHGRSKTTYDERKKLELYYVYKRNILLDINIFFST